MIDVIRMEPEDLEILDFEAAVVAARPGNLFPSNVSRTASLENPRLIRALKAELAHGFRLRPVEIVRVAKGDRTTRPAADMPHRDQIAYAALVAALRSEVPQDFVTFTGEGDDGQSYREFEEFPLKVEGASHVLEADAAAFYQNIDHERLASELIGLTGITELVEVLAGALEGWMGAPRGLPQGPGPSQPLADIYISPASRALARAGFTLSRFSDDFRIPVGSWTEIKRAQLAIEEAFYDLGLAVAPGKLKTPRIETYRGWLEKVKDPRITGAASLAALTAMEDEEYFSGEWEPQDVSAEQVAGASDVLAEQLATLKVTVTTTRLVRRSLGILASVGSPRALSMISSLLTQYAHLTPAICRYWEAVLQSKHEDEGVDSVLRELSGTRLRLAWQVGWLLHVLSLTKSARQEVAEVTRPRIFDESLPWFARAAAARATAIHGALPPLDQFFGVYERATDAARPDLVAAVVAAEPSWSPLFLSGIGPDPILQDIAQHEKDDVRMWF